MNSKNPFRTLKYDLPASLVVALVALPLCLGIALASGASLFSGLLSGIIGGVIVGAISGSHISVSGPAAGLTVIVLTAITTLGSFPAFLLAVVLAGAIQIILGLIKAGAIGNFFPTTVIKGMLAAIGVILIMKQIPHAVGYDADVEGDENFEQPDGHNTLSEMLYSLDNFSVEIIVISLISLAILLLFDTKKIKESVLANIPASLVVVLAGMGLSFFFETCVPQWSLQPEHLVSLPKSSNPLDFFNHLSFPDFSQIQNKAVWVTAFTLAIVASLETLLSIEAADKLDPFRRSSPQNRELLAQGVGNMVSGLVGGLPVTAVIVRTSANVAAGGITKLSAIFHGFIILLSVVFIPSVLNLIPLSSLAVILIMVGYKLTKPTIFKDMYKLGWAQFVPFIVTILAIVFTDMLRGIAVGMLVSVFFILKSNFRRAILVTQDGNNFLIKFVKDVTFLNKSYLRTELNKLPNGANVIIDTSRPVFVDHDIEDLVEEFTITARNKEINLEFKKKKEDFNF